MVSPGRAGGPRMEGRKGYRCPLMGRASPLPLHGRGTHSVQGASTELSGYRSWGEALEETGSAARDGGRGGGWMRAGVQKRPWRAVLGCRGESEVVSVPFELGSGGTCTAKVPPGWI